ncbi:MAG: hypothetical protein AB8G86_21190 [Saprospiraceae bacterium]
MDTSFLYSQRETFSQESTNRQKNLIEIDAYNLMIRFLVGNISIGELNDYLTFLSNIKLQSKKELSDFIKTKASYETYIQANGKSREERLLLKSRLFQLIEKHKKS